MKDNMIYKYYNTDVSKDRKIEVCRGDKKMKEEQQNNLQKIAFICFFVASICFYISAIIGIISKEGDNWIQNLCLGSAFLGLSTTHLKKVRNY